ncbi:class I SAM-dependent methyltransferase [Moorella sp. ACPs]|uniref:class I SAM-dependent methyltransferase n=1 Tax=Neomoorella carbonis TaxID=3062783 RepID=UPI0032527FC5
MKGDLPGDKHGRGDDGCAMTRGATILSPTRLTIKMDATFDEVICSSAFPHFPYKLKALKEMALVLKQGGRVVICHTKARETINNLHRSLGGVIAGDQIPPGNEMMGMLVAAGLTGIEIDEGHDYYLASGVKARYQ